MWSTGTNLDRTARASGPDATYESGAEAEEAKIPVLGKTLFFRGELTAEEDLILQGRVEGSIRHARALTIGTEGSVLGDVYAAHLIVEGNVEGDLHGSEAVLIRSTAQVRGNIYAPRVGIMEGAVFNGRIEMEAAARPARAPQPQPPASPGMRQQPQPPRPAAPTAPAPQVRPNPPGLPPAGARPSTPSTPGSAHAPAAVLPDSTVDQMLTQSTPRK